MSEQSKMTNEEAQKREDMLLDMYKISAYSPNDAQGNPLTPFGNFCAGYEAAWQASAKLSDKEKQEQSAEIAQLKADNNRLREALEKIAETNASTHGLTTTMVSFCIKNAKEALSKTPAQSMTEHDNEVIDRCSKRIEHVYPHVAAEIRALKGN